jgi:hypothetical protein
MPISAGLELWFAYNRRLLAILERYAGPVVYFGDYLRQVSAVVSKLGFESPARFDFPKVALRNQSPHSLDGLDNHVLDVYDRLRSLSTL